MIATIVISILLFAAVVAILMKINKNRREGKSSCGCGGSCGSCAGSPLCHPPKKEVN
jgi:hypothetical protein